MSLMHLLSSPTEIAASIGQQAQAARLAKNLSRKTLSQRSGVSESSIKRFELTGSTSLESLILLATALDALDPVAKLFYRPHPESLAALKNSGRKRGSL